MMPSRRILAPMVFPTSRRAFRLLALGIGLVIGNGATPVCAQRWYGTGQVSVSESRANLDEVPRTGHMLTNVFVNVEDVVFYKNQMRLAGRFDWRKDLHSSLLVSRPVYYFDLSGYGYALTNSYSQYKRSVVLLENGLGAKLSDLSHKDWRSALAVHVPRYPWLTLSYNRLHTFDESMARSLDLTQRSFVGEAGYARDRYSLQGNYSEVHRFDQVRKVSRDDIQALSGTVSATTPSWRAGFASGSYNYYGTQRDGADSLGTRSRTHSVSGLAASTPWRPLSLSLSYSGRFTETTQHEFSGHSRSQTASAGATWSPAPYVSAGLVEVYQVEGEGTDEVLQYLAFSGALSKSLRQGVDTRLSMSRTIYQQSSRVVEQRDTSGAVISTKRLDPYTIDTYFGGFGLWPLPYVDVLLNLSLTRDSESPQPENHYQLSSSLDGRFFMAANLEGRVSYSAASWGPELHQVQSHTETVNSGLSWLPRRNLNLSASYIVSSYERGAGHTTKQLGLYVNYSFRRAFTFWVSFNEQAQELNVVSATPGNVSLQTVRPRTTNIQLMIYTSRRSTLTVGYLDGRSTALSGQPGLQSETWSGTFNFQF